jgi:hypothetical protein
MKISAIVGTRNRAQRAGGVIECARNLMSGRHNVEFVVALDADDKASIDYFAAFAGVTSYVQQRPIGVGDIWNRAARDHRADIYLALPDDAWICTPGWDAVMVQVLGEGLAGALPVELGIISWFDPVQPTIASIFGMTAEWVEMNGFIFDRRFPFWWGDSALVETALFATASGMPGTDALKFASMPGNVNPRLRDMDLWWDFFAATRPERIETAMTICRRTGLPRPSDAVLRDLVRQCEERDELGRRQSATVLASIEDPLPPSDEYRQAKAEALAYLQTARGRIAA